jgi:DNA invertase Pin-like site-specific DNA recombinase
MMKRMVRAVAWFERAMIPERTSASPAVAGTKGQIGGRHKKPDTTKCRAESVVAELPRERLTPLDRVTMRHVSGRTGVSLIATAVVRCVASPPSRCVPASWRLGARL